MRGELCQENPQFSQLSTNLIRHESIETSRIHLTKSTEEQRDTLRLLDLCEQIRRQVSGIVYFENDVLVHRFENDVLVLDETSGLFY